MGSSRRHQKKQSDKKQPNTSRTGSSKSTPSNNALAKVKDTQGKSAKNL